MGSERVEMGKRPSQDAGNATQVHCTPPKAQMTGKPNTQTMDWLNAPPNACCFCWCCCCSCSCLTVRSGKEEKIQTTVADEEEDAQPEQKLELTLEEVQSWSESFEKLIKSPEGRAHFQQFLKFEFSEENMLFWLACEELKKETNRTTVEQTVKRIYEDYVSVLSPKEVSLDSQARELISSKMQDPSSCTFDEAQLQIHTLMQRDSYPRYINSSTYTDLLKSFQQSDQS
ncbi:regulator of G-protein signaling 20 [Triplophysa dalaica]|uniref:regulator of G-protein signaling 20 n=1 Tax=Triplophysa dalaica TaxID=1582913 RepID=UPI0024DF51C8|nr:regulator of G-protein signaling 20 [Triplophysa dalaica]